MQITGQAFQCSPSQLVPATNKLLPGVRHRLAPFSPRLKIHRGVPEGSASAATLDRRSRFTTNNRLHMYAQCRVLRDQNRALVKNILTSLFENRFPLFHNSGDNGKNGSLPPLLKAEFEGRTKLAVPVIPRVRIEPRASG